MSAHSKAFCAVLIIFLLLSAAAIPLRDVLELTNIALVYQLVIVIVAFWLGRVPAVFAALFGSLAFAYVFVPPVFSLAIPEVRNLVTTAVMLVVALLVGHLTASLKNQVEEIRARERQSRALYELARELTGAMSGAQVVAAAQRFLAELLDIRDVTVVLPSAFAKAPEPVRQTLERASGEADKLVLTSDSGGRTEAHLLLSAPMGVRGIMVFALPEEKRLPRDALSELLQTMAAAVGVALERIHYLEAAHASESKIASEKLRNSILTAFSHDLRTPLTALIGMADALALRKVASVERQQSMVEAIREEAIAIHRLVTNLLDMARLNAGAVTLCKEWQPVEEVIGTSLRLVESRFAAGRIRLDIAANLPPIALDAVLIERVLCNLIENAGKYSPAEAPIDLRVCQVGEYMEFSVCDQGAGFPDQFRERLFEMFVRGNSESSIPGVGLGLAIARNIVEAHGGTIDAENRRPQGACFRFRLPIGDPPALADLEGGA